MGHTQEAKQEYLQILSEVEVFTTPKPVALMRRIFEIATSSGDLILDSFAGSGTTAHAVLELNKSDGGNRRFILVQMPYDSKENEKLEFNICRRITAERVRRVIHGYRYTKRGAKGKSTQQRVEGLEGAFTYARVVLPLFGEYRDLGPKLPLYEELAKYIFYTETSHDFDRDAINEKTSKIGEYKGTSYYLLYTPDGKKDRALDLDWLASLDKTEKNRRIVVYCEKIWVHRDDLAKYEAEAKRTVRPMLVPFSLK